MRLFFPSASVLKDTPPPLGELRAELPRRLGRIVARCLAKEPRQRYQSARDLAANLAEVREESKEPRRTSSADLSPRGGVSVGPARGRSVARALGGAGIVLLVVAGAALAGWGVGKSGTAVPVVASANGPATRASKVERFVRLTSTYGVETGPQIAPDGTWVVYAAGFGDSFDVYRQRVGGRKRTNLTEVCLESDWQPAISPDAERIAFRSERDGGGIYVMGATGESVRRVTDFGNHPAWSPDGKTLVVSTVAVANPRSRGHYGEAWLVDVEGGEKRRLEAGVDAVQGSWSPDGRHIVFYGKHDASRNGLLSVTREGGEPKILLDLLPERGKSINVAWSPWWTADGGAVFFSSTTSGAMNIWRMPVDPSTGFRTGDPEPVTAGVNGAASYPSLTRDGKRMVFSVSAATGNLARVRFDPVLGRTEGEPMMLTHGSNGYTAPDVSPDGQWVTFCSSWIRPDQDENIYVMRSDGSDLRALTEDVGFLNRLPRWTGDGKSIVFYSSRSGRCCDLWTVAPDGSGLAKVTDLGEAVLFGIPAWGGTRAMAISNGKGLLEVELGRPPHAQSVKRYPPFSEKGYQFWPTDWSPDGKLVAGVATASDMDVLGVFTFSPESATYEKVGGAGGEVRWLGDGRRLLHTDFAGRQLMLIDLTGKQSQPILSVTPDTIFSHLSISRDMRWIYFSLVREDGDLWLAEL